MQVITARVPDEVFKEIKEMEEIEHIDRAEAARRLLSIGIKEVKRRKALELLREHRITYRRAAEMMRVTMYELLDLMEKEGIDIGYSLSELEKDLDEIE